MRQQVVDASVRMGRQPFQHVAQVGPRAVSIELGGLHQAHHHGGPLPGQLATCEQPAFTTNSPWTNLVFQVVVVCAL